MRYAIIRHILTALKNCRVASLLLHTKNWNLYETSTLKQKPLSTRNKKHSYTVYEVSPIGRPTGMSYDGKICESGKFLPGLEHVWVVDSKGGAEEKMNWHV